MIQAQDQTSLCMLFFDIGWTIEQSSRVIHQPQQPYKNILEFSIMINNYLHLNVVSF
jgi:hypothetical protein